MGHKIPAATMFLHQVVHVELAAQFTRESYSVGKMQ